MRLPKNSQNTWGKGAFASASFPREKERRLTLRISSSLQEGGAHWPTCERACSLLCSRDCCGAT